MLRGPVCCLAAAALLLTSACADASTAGNGGPSTSGSSATSIGTASSTDKVKGVEIVVSVKDGTVTPPTHRVKVKQGTHVQLLVTSDVDDEVHVHGYDIEREVAAGETATIDVTADQKGVFEVETHESGLQLLQLEVT